MALISEAGGAVFATRSICAGTPAIQEALVRLLRGRDRSVAPVGD
jgi:hypothetical protein